MGSQRVYIILRVKLGHIPSYSTPPPLFFFGPSRPTSEGDGTVRRRVLRQRQADEGWGDDGVSGLNNVLK